MHRPLLFFVLSVVVINAFGCGTQGHQVIANLAAAQLTPTARNKVEGLLAVEPGATLASISTWADKHRNPATSPWHYINFPQQTCTCDKQRVCPNGQCVIEALNRQFDILGSNKSDEKRLTALNYVVQLVGDVHQPLHAGYQEDRGGNIYQLQAFMRGSNLHTLWDSGLVRNLNEETDSLTNGLL